MKIQEHMKYIRFSLGFVVLLWAGAQSVGGQGFPVPERGFVSWKPAPQWEDALLSGNGEVGTLVFGEPHDETIIINHALNHMPVRVPLPPINQASRLEEIRALIVQGRYDEAAAIPVAQSMAEGYGEKHWIDPFVPLCNLRVLTQAGNVSDYVRMVDFETGEAKVQWQQNGALYRRSLFVSRADSVVVLRLQGEAPLNVELFLRQHPIAWDQYEFVGSGIKSAQAGAAAGSLTYSTRFVHHYEGIPYGFDAAARVVLKGGSMQTRGERIVVEDADEVLVVMKLAALMENEASLLPHLQEALAAGNWDYDDLLAAQRATHGELFSRVRLQLGEEDAPETGLQSEAFVQRARSGSNGAIIERQFDAARYNILSSTGVNPPTLQGIWSGTWTPPWSSGFTHDGNVEVAVSHLLSAHTPELMEAYLSYHERMLPWYRENARRLFGTRGIHVPAHSSTHGYNIHFDETWTLSLWTGGAGWTAGILYDYFLYTGNRDLLRERIYPIMKESAWFYEDFLYEGADGKYVFNPSYSPENNPGNSTSQVALNATMDVMIAREVLRNCLEAGRLLGEEKQQLKKWAAMLEKMPDYRINEAGELAEWLPEKYTENHSHRHVSQLYSLYERIDPDFVANPALMHAARKTVEARLHHRRLQNGGEMVFGLAQLGMVTANMGEAKLTAEIIDWMSRYYWAPSLATYHNSGNLFNMDMSGGFPAVILRALAYSEPGRLRLLPALPPEWTHGSVEGMALRGQVQLSRLSWDEEGLRFTLVSDIDQRLEVALPFLTDFRSEGQGRVVRKGEGLELRLKAGQPLLVQVGR